MSPWAARCAGCGRSAGDARRVDPGAGSPVEPGHRLLALLGQPDAISTPAQAGPTNPDPGVPDPGVTGPSVTGPSVTDPGLTDPGVTGPADPSAFDLASEEDVVTLYGEMPRHASMTRPRRPGRRRARYRWALAVSIGVAAASVATFLSFPTGERNPGGRVLSMTPTGQAVLASSDGSVSASLPIVPGTGFLVSADGRFIATGTGTEYSLKGTALVPTGRDVPFVGAPGSWRAVDFSDHDAGLVATDDELNGSVGVEAADFSGPRGQLGTAESVVGDPAALGVFAVSTAPTPGSILVERRDVGEAPVVLASSTGLLRDLGYQPATPATLSVTADPAGDKIAVAVVTLGASLTTEGIVVLDRDGRLLAAQRVTGPVLSRPAWSPDGTSLLYASASPAPRQAISVWSIGHRPKVSVASTGPTGLGAAFDDCMWSDTGGAFLCAESDATDVRVPWLVGRRGGSSLSLVLGPPLPFAWVAGSD